MRVAVIVLVLLSPFWCLSQELEVVDLGHLMGEMKAFKSKVQWTNPHGDSLKVKLWSNRPELSFENKQVVMAPGKPMDFSYSINLDDTKGEQGYEIRLIDENDLVMHGFLLKSRVFEAEEDVFKAYRNEFYPFRKQQQVMNLRLAYRGEHLSRQFSLYNFGGMDLDLTGAYTDDASIAVNFEPAIVNHHAFTRLSVTFQSTEQHALGFERKKLKIYTKDSTLLTTIPVQYSLENRPESNPSLIDGGPHLTVSRLSHDFKVMKVGDIRTVEITLTNTGRSVLNIEKLEANCDCLEFDLTDMSLEQGQSTRLKVNFNAKGRLGYERKTLALFTNDPDQPTRVLTFKAHVK